jgi:hypothetical protein
MIKVEVLRKERLGTTEIRFQIQMFKSKDGTVWFQVVAPEWLTYQASQILAITESDSLSEQEKKLALIELLRQDVIAFGVSEAEQADEALDALITTWPVTINL